MNNFSELSRGDGAKFLMRWRGRQEGPYSASIIEAKLAANEIGLLHEMLHNGQWITIRDYVTKMEVMLRVKHQEREEQELQARKEAEQQMNEREDLRRIDFERGSNEDMNKRRQQRLNRWPRSLLDKYIGQPALILPYFKFLAGFCWRLDWP